MKIIIENQKFKRDALFQKFKKKAIFSKHLRKRLQNSKNRYIKQAIAASDQFFPTIINNLNDDFEITEIPNNIYGRKTLNAINNVIKIVKKELGYV